MLTFVFFSQPVSDFSHKFFSRLGLMISSDVGVKIEPNLLDKPFFRRDKLLQLRRIDLVAEKSKSPLDSSCKVLVCPDAV